MPDNQNIQNEPQQGNNQGGTAQQGGRAPGEGPDFAGSQAAGVSNQGGTRQGGGGAQAHGDPQTGASAGGGTTQSGAGTQQAFDPQNDNSQSGTREGADRTGPNDR